MCTIFARCSKMEFFRKHITRFSSDSGSFFCQRRVQRLHVRVELTKTHGDMEAQISNTIQNFQAVAVFEQKIFFQIDLLRSPTVFKNSFRLFLDTVCRSHYFERKNLIKNLEPKS